MKVVAKTLGYYSKKRVRAGESFTLATDTDFSESWMRKAGEEKKPAKVQKMDGTGTSKKKVSKTKKEDKAVI